MNQENQIDQILTEGFESVADGGVRAFTVDALSKRLAMSKKTIYKHIIIKYANLSIIDNYMLAKL